MTISQKIQIPVILFLAYCVINVYTPIGQWFLAPLVIVLVFIYIYEDEMNWWEYKRNPPPIAPHSENFLEQRFSYYQGLSVWEKKRFNERFVLFMYSRDFTIKGIATLPEEVKAMFIAMAVQVSFGLKEYLMPKFERIVLYNSTFPSPRNPNLHIGEVHVDGVLLFAADRLVYGFNHPRTGYNIGIHVLASAFQLEKNWHAADYPILHREEIVDVLMKIRGINSYNELLTYMGQPQMDLLSLSIEVFFSQPLAFRKMIPEWYATIAELLNQDPCISRNPILDMDIIIEPESTD